MSDTINTNYGAPAVGQTEVRSTHCATPKRFYITRGVDQPVIRTLPVTPRPTAKTTAYSTTPRAEHALPSTASERSEQRRKASIVPRLVRAAVERATR